jgi:hypothetical protein
MFKVIGWKQDDTGKVFLKTLDDVEEGFIEIPNDIYKELLRDGPPNEEKMIRDLINEIHGVRKERILTVEEVDKELADIGKEEKEACEALKKAMDKLDVEKWSAILRSLAGRRSNQGQRRHLVKLLHQEEGALSKELMTKL